MSKMSKFLIATALCAVGLPTAAMAEPIAGTSGGDFSTLSGCDTSMFSADCRIVNTSANGTNTQVQWGSNYGYPFLFTNPSTLTADDLAINVAANATNVKIAELTWFNSSNPSDLAPANFGVDYALTIAFTTPVGSTGASETFDLTIDSPLNPPGDVIGSFTTPDLSSLSFTLPGWTVSGLQYVADSGTFRCDSNGTSNANGTSWCNPEENSGNLYIEANFTQTPVPVPEPLTLSLFGAGLAGAAALRRRRKQIWV